MSEYLMYLRKSRQDNPNETVEEVLQRHEKQLQEYAILNFGYRITEDNIYREIVSGETIDDRPEVKEMFKSMEDSSVKGVLVIDPQRLTRGDLLDCGTVVHLFRYTNTLIVTPPKTYNLEDKFDRKLFEMELTRGNDYLEYTKEILARGRLASIKEGNYIGARCAYGYNKVTIDKKPTLEINETEAAYVKLIYELYLQGDGYRTIAHKLNELGGKTKLGKPFFHYTIKDILNNEIYIGKIRHQAVIQTKIYENGKLIKKRKRNPNYLLIDGKHEPIIDETTFYKVRSMKGNDARVKIDLELVNPFASLIKCKKCGHAITMKTYTRNNKKRQRYKCINSYYCSNVSCTARVLTNSISDALKGYLSDFKIKIENYDADNETVHKNILSALKNDLGKLEQKQNELYDFLENGIYSREVFVKRNKKLAKEREKIIEAIKKAEEYVHNIVEYKETYASLHDALELLKNDNVSAKIKNSFLKKIVDVIYYEKDEKGIKIEIILKE